MKIAAWFIALAISITPFARAQEVGKGQEILASDLNKIRVIGELGVPLGTVAEIRAEIMAGRDLHDKEHSSMYLLKVTHVNNAQLKSNAVLKFLVEDRKRVRLARREDELYELKTDQKPRTWTSTEMQVLEKGYVGRKMRLVVYETGAFSGLPDNLPEDFPVPADHGFQFLTYLIVLADRSHRDVQSQASP